MPTVEAPRLPLDKVVWAQGTPMPMPTSDPNNFPFLATTPPDWYRPVVFASGCENPANTGSSGTGGGSFLYDPTNDAWIDVPHFLGMDPSYSSGAAASHGAAAFHPVGPTGTAISGSASGIIVDKCLDGEVAVGATIRITGGTGAGQSRTITATSGQTRSASYLPTMRAGSYTASSVVAGGVRAVSTPTGVQQGDLMVLLFYTNQMLPTITPPAGWSQAVVNNGGLYGMWLWYKVADVGEPATYNWTIAAGFNPNYRTWAIKSATYVGSYYHQVASTRDTYAWSTNIPMYGHRLGQFGIVYNRNGVLPTSLGGVDFGSAWGADLSAEELRSGFMSQPSLTLQTTDSQSAWINVVAQANGSYTEQTTLEIDTAWSVQPDATSTYEIDSGSFWCWRGNASETAWRWAKYDIARNYWEQKSTDSSAAPTVVGSAFGSTSGADQVVTLPVGVTTGDLMIVVSRYTTSSVPPAGWTLLTSNAVGLWNQAIYYKFYDPSDPDPLTWPTSSALWMAVYRDAGTPTASLANYTSGTAASSWSASTAMLGCINTSMPSTVLLCAMWGLDAAAGVTSSEVSVTSSPANDRPDEAVGVAEATLDSTSGFQATSHSERNAWFSWPGDWTPTWTWTHNLRAKVGCIVIPPATAGLSQFGVQNPFLGGGVSVATDSDDVFWLGGDTQTAIHKYVVSTDAWSTLASHVPSSHPLRFRGGGLVFADGLSGWADAGRYLFAVCQSDLPSLYSGEVLAYDTQTDTWYDLFSQVPGIRQVSMPAEDDIAGIVNGRLIWSDNYSRKIYVHRPDMVDTFDPEAVMQGPAGAAGVGGSAMFAIDGADRRWIYFFERAYGYGSGTYPVQGVRVWRALVDHLTWAVG